MAQYEDLNSLKAALSLVVNSQNPELVVDLREKFLGMPGKDGILTTLMKNLGKFPPDQRKVRGEALTRFTQDIHALLGA